MSSAFDRRPAPKEQVITAGDKLVIQAWFADITPEETFRYWTDPDLLRLWWPEQAEVEPREGGRYSMLWPLLDRALRGSYTSFEPGRLLGFTWKWDHEPGWLTKYVLITFRQLPGGGTLLTLGQGIYGSSSDDRKERQSHIEGWTYFLGRLLSRIEDSGGEDAA